MVNERPTISESWSGKKLGFFQKLVQRSRCAQRVAPPWSSFGYMYRRPRCGPRARACALAPRLGSDAFGDKGAQTSNVDGLVDGSVVKRSTVPGREANKLNVDDVES
jgi:hypothetical protein